MHCMYAKKCCQEDTNLTYSPFWHIKNFALGTNKSTWNLHLWRHDQNSETKCKQNRMKSGKLFAMSNLPSEACQKPKTLYIQPIHLHPWLDETDSSPVSRGVLKFRRQSKHTIERNRKTCNTQYVKERNQTWHHLALALFLLVHTQICEFPHLVHCIRLDSSER